MPWGSRWKSPAEKAEEKNYRERELEKEEREEREAEIRRQEQNQ